MINGIINWNPDPVIFLIGDTIPLTYYGVLFVLGLVMAHSIAKKIFVNENIPLENLEKLFIYIALGTFLGARLGHCFFYDFAYFSQNPLEILIPFKKIGGAYQFIGYQGLASHGGAIGIIIALGIYCVKHKTNLLWVLDRTAIVAPITAAFIRMGNFMNSEIYGKPTNGNWGIVFERNDLIPRHPSQLYEVFSYVLIFGILLFIYRNKIKERSNGFIFGVFLVLLFSARFIIEFSKENQVGFENEMTINMGQWLSIPFVVVGLILIVTKKKSPKLIEEGQ